MEIAEIKFQLTLAKILSRQFELNVITLRVKRKKTARRFGRFLLISLRTSAKAA